MSAIAWELPDDVRAVRDGLLDFARKEILPRHEAQRDLFEDPRRLYREDGRFSDALKALIDDVRRVSAKAGYYNMCVPESLGGGGFGPSSRSGRRCQAFKAPPVLSAGTPRAPRMAGPQRQPVCAMVMARAPKRLRFSFVPANSANNAAAARCRVTAPSTASPSGDRYRAVANAPGVGRQKCAGRVKANSSRTSYAASDPVPNRRAVARAWQTMGVSDFARLNAAAPVSSSTSPSVLNQMVRRAPATMAGAAKFCVGDVMAGLS